MVINGGSNRCGDSPPCWEPAWQWNVTIAASWCQELFLQGNMLWWLVASSSSNPHPTATRPFFNLQRFCFRLLPFLRQRQGLPPDLIRLALLRRLLAGAEGWSDEAQSVRRRRPAGKGSRSSDRETHWLQLMGGCYLREGYLLRLMLLLWKVNHNTILPSCSFLMLQLYFI